MAITVKHAKVSAVPDEGDASLIRPSDWNSDHTLLGLGTAAEKDNGVANGVASLDSGGTVPLSQLPASIKSGLVYKGTWNASTNTPTLTSSVGTANDYYVVSVAGTTSLNGTAVWAVNDLAIFSGSVWQKVSNSNPTIITANSTSPALTVTQTGTGNALVVEDSASDTTPFVIDNAGNVSTGGTLTVAGKLVVDQSDIGTAPNEIPLNQYLGSMAYEDRESVNIGGGVATLGTATITSIQNDTAISNVEPSLMLNFAAVEALDPRITFARATTATYYDGVTNSKAEQNLLTYSQEFDNASWTKTNATVTANTTVAPDGTTTADKVAASVTTTTSVRVNQASFSTTSGTSYILSVFAKKDDIDFILLLDATTNKGKYFNLDTGVVGADEGGAPAASSITSFGNGWYRCTITITASTTLGARIYISSADATIGYAATTGQGLYIWGAQIEQRDAVTAYTPTTTQPITLYQPTLLTAPSGVARFDHNPTTTESLGLLIEEQRTNLLLYSEQFDNAYWTKVDSTITANTIVAPDGTLTGDKLVEVVAVGQAGVQRDLGNQTGSFSWSIYAKAGERSWLSLIAYASAANRTWFNLSNGTVGTNASGNTASIVPVGNGWYKCTVSRTLSGTQNVLFIAKIATGDNIISYTGDGYSGIYIWGAQLEASSFSTSYIPTVASQVTRSADSASMTGANFSSWYRADEGTVYGEWLNNGAVSGKFPKAYNISDGTNNNTITRFADVQFSANAMSVTTNSVLQAFINAGAPSNNTNYKFADVYKVNDFAACVNAGTVGVDTNGIVPVVNQITIGADAAGSNRMSGHIKKLSYFPARLSNEELQEMTS